MVEIRISDSADWDLFENLAKIFEKDLGGYWKERLDGADQRYWDLVVEEQVLTLHLEHYLGVSVLIYNSTNKTAYRVRELLNIYLGN